jgi:hypothetical protein
MEKQIAEEAEKIKRRKKDAERIPKVLLKRIEMTYAEKLSYRARKSS